MTKLLTALRNTTRRIEAEIEDSKLFQHKGERGTFREQIVSRLLRPFLPACYGVGTGEVFSEDGASSNQVDLVIYDAVFSNVLFRDGATSLFPCESVYGSIEVKSNLSTEELEMAIGNIRSLKRLPRAASDMMDLLPFSHLDVDAPLTYNTAKLNPYLGIIFAYDGLTAESAGKVLEDALRAALQKNPADADLLPNGVFCLKRGYLLLRSQASPAGNGIAPLLGAFTGYGSLYTGDDTLAMFFLYLNTALNLIRLRAPNYNAYFMRQLSELLPKQPSK
jgi:hypothetical protein